MRRGGGAAGAVSLAMIFCVLCMAVFAVLTLSTAVSEAKLTALTAQRTEAYYQADAQAVTVLADLAAGRTPAVEAALTETEAGMLAEFALPAGGELLLQVQAQLDRASGRWDILRWKTVYGGDWAADETIAIWDGE